MSKKVIKDIKPLGFPWTTQNPFLFCVHHLDHYPKGNDRMGPDASLAGRNLGNDFTIRDGWRMYHGDTVPGFPSHPHRGFETVTVVLRGYVDHSDSHGETARYGNGDVQWMTAGSGLQHAEMFPLLNKDGGNTLELFQIWLNLPANKKFVEPHFKMLWAESIPVVRLKDTNGKHTEVIVIAGPLGETVPPAPAPDSWAADPANEVIIWRIKMEPGATWTLPVSSTEAERTLFFFDGTSVSVEEETFSEHKAIELYADQPAVIRNDGDEAYFLLLQGRPLPGPVVQYGPFVMNTEAQIREAMLDFQRTRFGGWPWDRPDPVLGPEARRFARYADGHEEGPQQ